MMTEYQIQSPTRRCAATGRELRPGERYFTALMDEGGKFIRRDICTEAWQGPPIGCFSFWSAKLPVQGTPKRLPIDDDILLECFDRLEDASEPARIRFRYIIALLLVRRRRLKLEDTLTEEGQELMLLRSQKDRKLYRVPNLALTDDELASVQDEVFRVLGWD